MDISCRLLVIVTRSVTADAQSRLVRRNEQITSARHVVADVEFVRRRRRHQINVATVAVADHDIARATPYGTAPRTAGVVVAKTPKHFAA